MHDPSARPTGVPHDLPEDDLARLSLVNEAIWLLVSRRLGLRGADLRAAVDELRSARERAGVGRPRPCPACASMVPVDRTTCQFCGAHAPEVRAEVP